MNVFGPANRGISLPPSGWLVIARAFLFQQYSVSSSIATCAPAIAVAPVVS